MASDEVYCRAQGAVAAVVDGETVVLSPTDLRYHSLNVTAAAIWELLAEPTSVAQVVERLLDQFEVDPSECAADVDACLADLRTIGVIDT